MSTEAIGAAAPVEGDSIDVVHPLPSTTTDAAAKPIGLHSPPDSNNAVKLDGSDDDSELSDVDDAIANDVKLNEDLLDDIGEVEPDHFSGTVPVFKPTMHQFKDFKKFMAKVDKYGMKSGIIKIVPPQEWKESLPPVDDLVKTVRVREPIKQEIMGNNGTYRQVNILHQRSYNLPQWRQLCDQSEHQPPAKRGERRANAEKPKPAPRPRPAPSAKPSTAGSLRRSKRGRGGARKKAQPAKEEAVEAEARPMTPESPKPEEETPSTETVADTVEADPGIKVEEDDTCDSVPVAPRRMGFTRQSAAKTQSTSARRKYAKREGSAMIDEAAFRDFDYKMDVTDYTPERCEELERIYWKTLTYAPPLYGADLPGTMFHESTDTWNLNKLPNLLDVLGTKVPGVNTAYLYLGMWKATFAWHLEDVDLYSINYLHFGAPKQWYSISQGDARRFEAAMKNIWPNEAKACDQFLRHKAFLISPSHLLQHYNIRVNKCVSYPGEFVVTYPYGYHSGYNLGYNCAEAVNFALDTWLPMGKIARKCECAQAQDSVWVDVYEIERKLRGESTEYEITDDEEEDDEDDSVLGLPTPPASSARVKMQSRKRKRPVGEKDKRKVKKIRLRVKNHVEPPCCLCPNDIPSLEILSTDDGRKAHRLCALYLPETYIETEDGKEVVTGASNIDKARLDLRCMYCRSKRGACFQCSFKKCTRSYHATCAAAAGVFVEEGDVPVFGEDGKEYKEQAFEFTCRFQRAKRDKKLDGDALDKNSRVREAARALKKGQMCQMQFYRSDIFAGVIVENRHDEETLLLDITPNGDRVEVEWKWLLLPDPSDYRLPKASSNALPLPLTRKAKDLLNAKKRPEKELPRADDPFVEGCTWAEFHTCEAAECANKEQVKVDFSRDNQLWHYLGRTSTETKAQYTEDPAKQMHNPKSIFLDTIPKPPKPVFQRVAAAPVPRSFSDIKPPYVPHSLASKDEKPYVYKPRMPLNAPPPGHRPVMPHPNLGNWMPRVGPHPGQPYSPGGQQLSFGSDPRFKVPPAFAGDRSAPSVGAAARAGPSGSPSYFSHGYTTQPPNRAWQQPPAAQPACPPNSLRPWPPRPSQEGAMAAPRALNPPAAKQSTTPIPPPKLPASSSQMSTFKKYGFFQVHHNKDSSGYKTPYATWGGFKNGYEGNQRANPTKQGIPSAPRPINKPPVTAQTPSQKPPQAHAHKRSGSFGLGGGLAGLTRPKAHLNYNSPPSSSSSSSSPFAGSHAAHSGSTGLSSASSYGSYDAMFGGGHKISHSPSHSRNNPFAGSPEMPIGGFGMRQQGSAPLHPAIRPQYGPVWRHDFQPSVTPFVPAAADVNFSPPSPITAGLAASPIIHQQPFMPFSPMPAPPFAAPVKKEAEMADDLILSAKQTPAEQLKQQLRRISDPPHPSSYSAPHPAIKREAIAHAVVSPQIPLPLPASAQAAAPEPQQPQPNLHEPIVRSQPGLKHGEEPLTKQNQAAAAAAAATGQPQASAGVAAPELPEVPTGSAEYMEKMMANLRKASALFSIKAD